MYDIYIEPHRPPAPAQDTPVATVADDQQTADLVALSLPPDAVIFVAIYARNAVATATAAAEYTFRTDPAGKPLLTQLPHLSARDAVIQGFTGFLRHHMAPRKRTPSGSGP